jgi:quinoprotein dehydrogenase-associated probable ABC transporter substrate-binding protein
MHAWTAKAFGLGFLLSVTLAATSGLPAPAGFVFGASSAEAAQPNRADLVNRRVLRVCSDPANMPFSAQDEDKPGFENKIAEIVADEMGVEVEYTWFPQATGFVRRTLFAKACDIVIGFAQGDELVLNTNHYYRSAYSLVYRKGGDLDGLDELSDPRLKDKKIGLVAGSPPATVISRLGLLNHVKPYGLMIDRRHFSPSEEMIKDIASGEIDVGILWGPNAGYFAKESGVDMAVVPLLKEKNARMTFRITMGVRQSDDQWKRELNEILKKRQGDIDKVLLSYNIPIIDERDNMITEPRLN